MVFNRRQFATYSAVAAAATFGGAKFCAAAPPADRADAFEVTRSDARTADVFMSWFFMSVSRPA